MPCMCGGCGHEVYPEVVHRECVHVMNVAGQGRVEVVEKGFVLSHAIVSERLLARELYRCGGECGVL